MDLEDSEGLFDETSHAFSLILSIGLLYILIFFVQKGVAGAHGEGHGYEKEDDVAEEGTLPDCVRFARALLRRLQLRVVRRQVIHADAAIDCAEGAEAVKN